MATPTTRECAYRYECENPGTLRCSACKKVWYCSEECQKNHWNRHIFDCAVPIHTAYFLNRARLSDLIPTHYQTRIDYGFERAGEFEPMLLGLYKGMWYIGESLTPKEVHRWRRDGILVQKIKELFSSLPKNNRGGYYAWFLEHQYVLDGSPIPEEHTAEGQVKQMRAKVWDYLGKDMSEDEPQWPASKQDCFLHYAMLLSSNHPGPEVDIWISFGYCVAKDSHCEMEIARLYQGLIKRCTFDEFCEAYANGNLFNLIHMAGPLPHHLRHLSLVVAKTVRYSVWDLKRTVLGTDVAPVRSIVADYGFMNCRAQEEKEALADVYRAAFFHKDFDEVEMHEACIKGQILEYMKRFVPLRKKEEKLMRGLMKNMYPLADI